MSIPSIDRLKLYAYGSNIGGLPIFSADGKQINLSNDIVPVINTRTFSLGIAQIGDPNLSNASMKTPMCGEH